MELIGFVVAAAIAVGGWIVNARHDRRSRRQDIRTQFLIDAYRAIEDAANRRVRTAEQVHRLEQAISDVHLFGDAEHIRLVSDFQRGAAAGEGSDVMTLLESLRSSLRETLDLESTAPREAFFRLDPPEGGRG